MKWKLLGVLTLLAAWAIMATDGDTLTYSANVDSLDDGDTFFVSKHWGPLKDSIQSIINGRLGNVNLADDAEIKQSKIDSTQSDATDWLYEYTREWMTKAGDTMDINLRLGDIDSVDSILDCNNIQTDSLIGAVRGNVTGDLTSDTVKASSASGLWLQDDGGNGIFVEDGGQVGIGTASPDKSLHIKSATTTNLHLENTGDVGVTQYINSARTGSDNVIGQLIFQLDGSDAAYIRGVAGNTPASAEGFLTFSTNDGGGVTERMRIEQDGCIGIGSTSPTVPLEVNAALSLIHVTSTTGVNPAYFQGSNSGGSYISGIESSVGGSLVNGSSAYSVVVNNSGNYPLSLGTNNTERIRIDNSGNVGIDTTNPDEKLHVNGNVHVEDSVECALINTGPGWADVSTKTYGTFTCSLTVNGEDTTTGTAFYKIVSEGVTDGDVVHLTIPYLVVTSTGAAEPYIRGLPSAIQPGATYELPVIIRDNSVDQIGVADFDGAGNIQLLLGSGSSTFTAANLKGIQVSSFTYLIDN